MGVDLSDEKEDKETEENLVSDTILERIQALEDFRKKLILALEDFGFTESDF